MTKRKKKHSADTPWAHMHVLLIAEIEYRYGNKIYILALRMRQSHSSHLALEHGLHICL